MIRYLENRNKANIKVSTLKMLIFKEAFPVCRSHPTIKRETSYQKSKKKKRN